MKFIKTIPYVALLLAGLISCQEQIDWKLDAETTDLLVVDGTITNERTNHLIKLSRTNPNSNETFKPAFGATVLISDGKNVITLIEFPTRSGHYYTPSVRAVFGKIYTLVIFHNGQQYAGQDSAQPVESLSEFSYRRAADSLYTLNFQEGIEPSMTKYFMTWANTEYCMKSNDICFAKLVYYDLKYIDVNEAFKPQKELILFPENTVIVRKKYSFSDAYRAFLRSVLSETEWRGGQFDVQRGNTLTNMSEGAIGFFAVSMVVSDTTLITPIP